jgi:hypothetical protein
MRINQDFQKGFMVCAGVIVALYAVGVVTGVLRRVI